MDPTVLAGAAMLLEYIFATDAGKPVPACYGVIFGNRQKYLQKPLTSMTLGEVIDAQKNWSNRTWVRKNWDAGAKAASSAAGAAQFMRDTLIGLAKEFNLSGNQPFDPDFQDRMGYKLLLRRGYNEFMAGKISRTEFGKRLAMEWASFPVLAPCKGAKRNLKRGQSYYAGDGLNNALTSPGAVEALLDKVKAAGNAVAPSPVPVEAPKPEVVAQVPLPPATEPIAAKVPAQDAAVVVAVPSTSAPAAPPASIKHPAGWGALLALLSSIAVLIGKYLGVH